MNSNWWKIAGLFLALVALLHLISAGLGMLMWSPVGFVGMPIFKLLHFPVVLAGGYDHPIVWFSVAYVFWATVILAVYYKNRKVLIGAGIMVAIAVFSKLIWISLLAYSSR